jgi:hypothetical protein
MRDWRKVRRGLWQAALAASLTIVGFIMLLYGLDQIVHHYAEAGPGAYAVATIGMLMCLCAGEIADRIDV